MSFGNRLEIRFGEADNVGPLLGPEVTVSI